MAWLESGSQETWKDMVTNEHLVKCVKACLIDIMFAGCQNCMEPDNVSTVCQFLFYLEELGHENMLNLHMEWL